MVEQPQGLESRVEKHPQEPKIKILILEDQFAEQAQQGLNLPCFEVRVVKTLEELRKLDPQEFQPDIAILDIEVPEREGEKPSASSESENIIRKKYGFVPLFYYTSHREGESGVSDVPLLAIEWKRHYLEGRLWGKDKVSKLKEICPEIENIWDKSKPENWLTVLLLLPIIEPMKLSNANKLQLFRLLPEGLRNKMMKMLEIVYPTMAEAVKRQWEFESEGRKKEG
jgi:uncharacterized protein (UPF0335 family)